MKSASPLIFGPRLAPVKTIRCKLGRLCDDYCMLIGSLISSALLQGMCVFSYWLRRLQYTSDLAWLLRLHIGSRYKLFGGCGSIPQCNQGICEHDFKFSLAGSNTGQTEGRSASSPVTANIGAFGHHGISCFLVFQLVGGWACDLVGRVCV